MPTVQAHGITLYYEARGTGDPLLLIGGSGADLTLFSGVISGLAERHQVIAFDNTGAGRSDKPDLPYPIEMMAGDAAGLLDALAIGRADVMGISMGGRVALELALSHPGRVGHLVLVCTSAAGRRQRQASVGYDASDRLSQIHAPTLIAHGRRDMSIPLELAERMHAAIAGSQLEVFRGGHMFFLFAERQRLLDRVELFLASGHVRIPGARLLLRALAPAEIEAEWQAMVAADPISVTRVPDESAFKARLRRSGRLEDGWLDLAIDLDGVSIGRIQTFVPPDGPLPPGTFEVGIGLREDARGQGYGREAIKLLTGWLFEHAGAQAVEAQTDPANVAMRTVFERVGWTLVGPPTAADRDWVLYRITRPQWQAMAVSLG